MHHEDATRTHAEWQAAYGVATPAPTGDDAHEATLRHADRLQAHARLMRDSAVVLRRMADTAGDASYRQTAFDRERDADADEAGAAALRRLALVEAENERLTGLLASSDEEYRLHEVIAAENERLRAKSSISVCESFSSGFSAGALWARQPVIVSDEREALAAALADYAPFNPEWDMLEATRESLREHMAMVTALRQRVETLEASQTPGVIDAIKAWLDFGVKSYDPSARMDGKGHRGYFSRGGWAYDTLAAHLAALAGDPAPPPQEPSHG